MFKTNIAPRLNWQDEVEALGLIWHTANDEPYWNESAYYTFTRSQIEEIENASVSLYELFLKAGEHVVTNRLFSQFGIPSHVHQAIVDAWENEPPCLNYGRFDFGYDGVNPPRLFEFNCDTPTSLLEASVVQWYWKEQLFPGRDQYNSIHEALLNRWLEIKQRLSSDTIYFAHVNDDAGEDTITVSYMRDTAEEAGIRTEGILIGDIGWNGESFVDLDDRPISVMQHLYPWEWMVNEEFGKNIIKSIDHTQWIEPIWKMIWSNKAILPILSELAPDHPNLLHTSTTPMRDNYVKKAILAREGANIDIVMDGVTVESKGGDYGEEGYVYQELYKLPKFGDRYPVIGAWVVDGSPVGMGIREDGLITGNTARFVPHIII